MQSFSKCIILCLGRAFVYLTLTFINGKTQKHNQLLGIGKTVYFKSLCLIWEFFSSCLVVNLTKTHFLCTAKTRQLFWPVKPNMLIHFKKDGILFSIFFILSWSAWDLTSEMRRMEWLGEISALHCLPCIKSQQGGKISFPHSEHFMQPCVP